MISVNTTFFVPAPLVRTLLDWVERVYTGSLPFDLTLISVSRLLSSPEPGTEGVAVKVAGTAMGPVKEWNDGIAATLRGQLANELGAENVLFFSTYMEELA